ncbi:secreted RxLR effector protein 161-like [Rutidosis leptorrhynchoides]|uniref:secreted RxLR effector protein 161-like n=1 Tax=Rutidosis leptorrhynchoides TaxID=125765 RepID=UPI003A99F8D9
MNNEIKALYRNNTWVVSDLPIGRKSIGCKWICKIKYKSSGEIERYKAILVAKASKGDDFLKNISEYQKHIRKFIYLTHTKPHISYDIQNPSQHMQDPLQSHIKASLSVLRYLKGSPGKGLHIKKSSDTFKLCAYSDADWGKCLGSRRYVFGFCLFLCGSLISWKSEKQPTVSRSPTESEYRSLAATTCEIMWVLKLLADFGIQDLLHVQLYCDNKSAILLTANPVLHEKSKHFEIDVHIVREKNLSEC